MEKFFSLLFKICILVFILHQVVGIFFRLDGILDYENKLFHKGMFKFQKAEAPL